MFTPRLAWRDISAFDCFSDVVFESDSVYIHESDSSPYFLRLGLAMTHKDLDLDLDHEDSVSDLQRRLRLLIRTSCESRPITRPLTHSSSSHQSSSSGLATPSRSTKADMDTFGPITLVSTQRGCVCRIVQSGVSLWRRLCSLMSAFVTR